MKTKILLLAICITTFNSFAQTSIPGGNVSGLWTLTGSPYNVQGSIMIPDNSTLTIEPGVTVNFQGTFKMLVLGRLLAIGTISDTITFTAANTTNGWRGIRFDNTTNNNDTSRIIFCKLTYGKATGGSPDNNGGALYFNNFSKAIVSHCSIINCTANSHGGGIYCNYSNVIIIYNTIANNSAPNYYGGGISCGYSSPTISYNKIINNSSDAGGGIFCDWESINISLPIISYNTIASNYVSTAGGGVACWCNAIISYNTITNNSVSLYGQVGGGMDVGYNDTISNNIIANNSSNNTVGGGIFCRGGSPYFLNNTIVNNSAYEGGAVYCNYSSTPTFRDCILWGNTVTNTGAQLFLNDEASDPNFYYCDVEGGSAAFELNGNFYTGTYQNNINTFPLFVSPSSGSGTGYNGTTADWSLQAGSPCIDAGDPVGIYPATDIIGNLRISGCIIDIGAYEYQKGFTPPPPFSQSPTICNGQSVTVGSNTYTVSGTYHDTLTSYQGCDSTVTTILTVNSVDTSVSVSNATLTANASPATYQWINCNGNTPIPGQTNQSFTAVVNDNYAVIVTQNSCSDTSSCYNINTVGIVKSISISTIYIYPNPAANNITIESPQQAVIEITNIQGQLIKNIVASSNKINVDVSTFPSGMYFVKVKTEKGVAVQTFVKE